MIELNFIDGTLLKKLINKYLYVYILKIYTNIYYIEPVIYIYILT